jgi:hypothetical protein
MSEDSNHTMNVPETALATVIFLVWSSANTALLIPPTSSSLSPPRLFTSRITWSFPSFWNGTKERSGSLVFVMRSSSCGMSSLRGGTGERRLLPGSLWMPIPISISSALRWVSPVAVPGTCNRGFVKFRNREAQERMNLRDSVQDRHRLCQYLWRHILQPDRSRRVCHLVQRVHQRSCMSRPHQPDPYTTNKNTLNRQRAGRSLLID